MANLNVAAMSGKPRTSRSTPRTIKSFDCGIHMISYESDRPGCPVCYLERQDAELRRAVTELKNKLHLQNDKLRQLESFFDVTVAIREAIPLLDDDDLAFLKATCYEWRNNKSLTLKVTRGARKKKREPSSPNGFIVVPRTGDPYGHLCGSVGGLAIAEYFDEAMNGFGAIRAMELLIKGMAQHLPGGQG